MVDVRGDVLRPPHGTTPAAVKTNKYQKVQMCFYCYRTFSYVFTAGYLSHTEDHSNYFLWLDLIFIYNLPISQTKPSVKHASEISRLSLVL